MTYTYINSKNLIADMYDRFNIQSSEFQDRFASWVADCINDIKVYTGYISKTESITVSQKMAKIPEDCMRIDGVFVGTKGLDKNMFNVESEFLSCSEYSQNNGYIYVSFESGTLDLTYSILPIELDEETGKYYPVIPNEEHLKDAIRFYVLYIILSRGYIHPIYSLKENDYVNNPFLRYESLKPKARVACAKWNRDDYNKMDKVLNNFYTIGIHRLNKKG